MKRNYHSNTAFLDFLFNTLLCFAALFALSFILINPSKKDNTLKVKAEFIIIVTWPTHMGDDVDTCVEDPDGNLVAFMRREEGLMHLDRDDLGNRNDTIQTPFGEITYPENREIVTIRGSLPGEYVINVHMYHKETTEPTTPITVRVDKINPYSTVVMRTVELGLKGDEKTVCRFTVNKEGEVTSVNELQKSLIEQKRSGEIGL